jgi:hypothetical protein
MVYGLKSNGLPGAHGCFPPELVEDVAAGPAGELVSPRKAGIAFTAPIGLVTTAPAAAFEIQTGESQRYFPQAEQKCVEGD